MPTEYTNLVTALKALSQGEGTDKVYLPMAEDEWNTRPDTVSYGTVRLDFEADALGGDDRKVDAAYEGSVDLYTHGNKWTLVAEVESALESVCGSSWRLNSIQYERETGLVHREFVFQIEAR